MYQRHIDSVTLWQVSYYKYLKFFVITGDACPTEFRDEIEEAEFALNNPILLFWLKTKLTLTE